MMAIGTGSIAATAERARVANGSAMAAFLGAGIGAFAMGLVVLLNELGIFAAPTLYGPAGGVSGRTTVATVLWVVAWGVLHRRWRERDIPARRIYAITLILIGLGVLGTFPPVWKLL
jgi:hypothetical protein